MRKETDTKKKVLEYLEANSMNFISGQDIAKALFMTRANVWKAIKSLQAEGHRIEAVSNRGYRLVVDNDLLYAAGVEKFAKLYTSAIGGSSAAPEINGGSAADETCGNPALPDCPLPLEIHVYDEIDSTNDEARRFAQDSRADRVFIAGYQSKGRGRRGRVFHSPKGTGLYLSFLLHPQTELDKATLITAMTSVAVARAIERATGIYVGIKWVNDLFLGDKKISGILTEGYTSIEDGSLDYLIIGIGINLLMPPEGFPEEIKKTAGVLFPSGQKELDMRNRISGAIIAEFMNLYHQMLPTTAGNESAGTIGSTGNVLSLSFLEEYRKRSILIGGYVKITNFRQTETGDYAKVIGIDDECHLVVEREDKTIEHLSTGEVSVVKY